MERKGFSPVPIIIIVVVVFAVVAISYYFAVVLPSHRIDYQTGNIPADQSVSSSVVTSTTVVGVTSTATSTASSSFFGGMIQVADNASATLPLFLYPKQLPTLVTSTVSIIGVIESSSQPLIGALNDPRFANGLSGDGYIKIYLLQAWLTGNPRSVVWTSFSSQEINVISDSGYLANANLSPGDVVTMQVANCALYNGWPDFTCTNNIITPRVWSAYPSDLTISWQGQNSSNISLTGASFDEFASSSVFSLKLTINSGYGEFCPSSLLNYQPGLLVNESGYMIAPAVVMPSVCIGPNTTSAVSLFLPVSPSTFSSSSTVSTVPMFTMNVIGPAGNSETFFNLYPLPNGELFIQSGSSTQAPGE